MSLRPLFRAARKGEVAAMASLIEADRECVHYTDEDDCTALAHAAELGHLEVVDCLLGHGASVNHRNVEGATALWFASSWDRPRVLELLLSNGADPTISLHDYPPLDIASHKGNTRVVELLLPHRGSHIDHRDNNGRTAVWKACTWGRSEVTRLLLSSGADPTIAHRSGSTAEYQARVLSRHGCVMLIEEWEAHYALQKARFISDRQLTPSTTDSSSSDVDLRGRLARSQSTRIPWEGRMQHARPRVDIEMEAGGATEGEGLKGLVVTHLVKEMNSEMVVELLQGFIGFTQGLADDADEKEEDGESGDDDDDDADLDVDGDDDEEEDDDDQFDVDGGEDEGYDVGDGEDSDDAGGTDNDSMDGG